MVKLLKAKRASTKSTTILPTNRINGVWFWSQLIFYVSPEISPNWPDWYGSNFVLLLDNMYEFWKC